MSSPPVVSQNQPNPQEDFSVNRLIGIALIIRIVVDTSVKIFFPFLPIIAQGLLISEVRLGRLLSLRAAMGMLAPLVGATADKRGYRFVMCCLLTIGAVGLLIIGLSSSFIMVAVGMGFAGLGLMTFSPTMAAYLSAQLPFERRSRGLGVTEYAWALSGMVGLPLIGRLMGWANWRVPFFILAGGLILGAIRIWFLPPTSADRVVQTETARLPLGQQLYNFFDIGSNWRSALSVMMSGFFIMMGGMTLLINYGSWFVQEYGLTAVALGSLAFTMGFADIIGSGIVSLVGDRLGKRNTVLIACILGMITFSLLPLFNTSYMTALVGTFLARFAFEFGIVGNMVLSSEQAPLQRGKVMTLSASFVTLSVAIASSVAPWIFASFGVQGISLVGGVSFSAAACALWFFANESG